MSPIAALSHLLIALIAGASIGLERSYHGRAAGARTYAIVCMASALPLVMLSWPADWQTGGAHLLINAAPNIIQGILTGIGFLGGGVILREGFSVHGLTSAASIWATSAIGIVVGSGFPVPGIVATAITIAVLSVLKAYEDRAIAQHYLRCIVGYRVGSVEDEATLREMLVGLGFHIVDMTYRSSNKDGVFEYESFVWTRHRENTSRLAQMLRARAAVCSFTLEPSSD